MRDCLQDRRPRERESGLTHAACIAYYIVEGNRVFECLRITLRTLPLLNICRPLKRAFSFGGLSSPALKCWAIFKRQLRGRELLLQVDAQPVILSNHLYA